MIPNTFPASSDTGKTLPVVKLPADSPTTDRVDCGESAAGGELFKIEPTLSPRLKWIYKHGVWTRRVEYDHAGPTEPEDLWAATAKGIIVRGHDEDDAITKLAIALKIPLWNEVMP